MKTCMFKNFFFMWIFLSITVRLFYSCSYLWLKTRAHTMLQAHVWYLVQVSVRKFKNNPIALVKHIWHKQREIMYLYLIYEIWHSTLTSEIRIFGRSSAVERHSGFPGGTSCSELNNLLRVNHLGILYPEGLSKHTDLMTETNLKTYRRALEV